MNPARLEAGLEQELHVSWYIVAYKLVTGFLELLFGLGILIVGPQALQAYRRLVSQELLESPRDLLVIVSQRIVPYVLSRHYSLSVFLILLGLAKIAGAIGLIYRKNWGVDLLIGVTLLLLPFQLFNLTVRHSLPDLFYILLGLFIAMYLINFNPRAYSEKIIRHIRRSR